MGLHAVDVLFLGLGEVDVEFHPVVHRETARPADHLLAHGIDRVDRHRQMGGFCPSEGFLVQFDALAALAFRRFLVELVQDDEGDVGADAHLHGRLAGVRGEPVLVVEGGGAALDHLQARHAGAPVDEFLVHLRLHRPDLLEPAVQRDVFRDAAQEDHGGVGVHVDETRDDGFAGTVHDLVGHEPALFREGEDPMDPVALDEEVDGYSVPLNVT